MASTDPYVPINCEFHDYFEHFATLRLPVTLCYQLNGLDTTIANVIIYDLTGGRNGEYAHVRNDELDLQLRMDHIVSINEITSKSFNSGFC
ncbi:MAG: hypothetical protein GQ574_15780 [Crocinitomix sp.]|nr:hypothetical protein [Crocinitomix sp.]